jgi:hypothetical protein
MKKLILSLSIAAICFACGTLHSTTYIKPNESFILGDNRHGSFSVKLKNISKNDLSVFHAPLDGGKHSTQSVKPNQSVVVKVDRNTALIIENKTSDSARVNLKVTGDVGLSMGYKN